MQHFISTRPSSNAFISGMYLYVSLAMRKSYDRLGSLVTVRQPAEEKENSEFKPAVLHLKIGHVLHPAQRARVG